MNSFSLLTKVVVTITLSVLPLFASANIVFLTGEDSRDITSRTAFLNMFDNSSASISEGGSVWSVSTVGNSTLNVNGGSLNTLWAGGSSKTIIESGSVGSIFSAFNSEITLSNTYGLGSVSLLGDSVLNLQATQVEMLSNTISGYWLDGSAFSFNFFGKPSNVVVSEVPVPAAFWLFSSAVMGLAVIGRRRRLGAQAA